VVGRLSVEPGSFFSGSSEWNKTVKWTFKIRTKINSTILSGTPVSGSKWWPLSGQALLVVTN
jgi:hypothetical protein